MRPVVVALQDGSVDLAVREGAALAHRGGGELVVVRVVTLSDPRVPRDLGPFSYLGPRALTEQASDPFLADAVRCARQAGVEIETELIAASDPAAAIADVARSRDASVVLVAIAGDGRLARLRARRLARRVRRLASAPVFAVGGRRRPTERTG